MVPSYPGVYVEEVDPVAHAVVAAETGIAAFVGRAPMGPLDRALTCLSFGDYIRQYGGLALRCPMSYAVMQFFQNGGTQAVIARLYQPKVAAGSASGRSPGVAELFLPVGGGSPQLRIMAASPGRWGNRLTATVDVQGISDAAITSLQQFGLAQGDLFNLTLTYRGLAGSTVSERYERVSVAEAGAAMGYPLHLDAVLREQSALARIPAQAAPKAPLPGAVTATGGCDGECLSLDTYCGDPAQHTGIHLLDGIPAFNLLCIPPDRRRVPSTPLDRTDLPAEVRQAAAAYCVERRAIFLVDSPADWDKRIANSGSLQIAPAEIGVEGTSASGIPLQRNAAIYFPNILCNDPLLRNRPMPFVPCGAIAGVIAATDVSRGVWKAPAGIGAGLAGGTGLSALLSDDQDVALNSLGINCLRQFPTVGPVVWGARTVAGADTLQDDYQYLSVRRLVLFLESSLQQAMRWAVFERNDETLWSSLRVSVGTFLAGLARQGAFYEYLVACDSTTTTAADVAGGVVNLRISIAPEKPAEFLVIQIQQTVGSASA